MRFSDKKLEAMGESLLGGTKFEDVMKDYKIENPSTVIKYRNKLDRMGYDVGEVVPEDGVKVTQTPDTVKITADEYQALLDDRFALGRLKANAAKPQFFSDAGKLIEQKVVYVGKANVRWGKV